MSPFRQTGRTVRGVALAAALVALTGAAPAEGAFEPDPSYGVDGRVLAPVGLMSTGAAREVTEDGAGGLVLAGRRSWASGWSSRSRACGPAACATQGTPEARRGSTSGARRSTSWAASGSRPDAWSWRSDRRLHTGLDAGDLLVGVTPAGALDPAFGDRGVVNVGRISHADQPLAVDAEGRLLLLETAVDDLSRFLVRRRTVTGALDASFGDGGTGETGSVRPFGIEVAPGGSAPMLVGSVPAGDDDDGVVARLTPAGALDEGYGTGGRTVVFAGGRCGGARLAVAPGGRAVAGCGGQVVQLTPGGAIDDDFGEDGAYRLDGHDSVLDIAYDAALAGRSSS